MKKTKIIYVGHATVLIETNGKRILTDPILRNRVGFLWRYKSSISEECYNNIDAVLISHMHNDHLDLPSLKKLSEKTKIIAPKAAGKFLKGNGLKNIEEVTVGDHVKMGSVKIRVVPANHSGGRQPLRQKSDFLGYIIEGSHRTYFPGDTDLFPEMDKFGSLDVALLPIWGWGPTLGRGHLNPQ